MPYAAQNSHYPPHLPMLHTNTHESLGRYRGPQIPYCSTWELMLTSYLEYKYSDVFSLNMPKKSQDTSFSKKEEVLGLKEKKKTKQYAKTVR